MNIFGLSLITPSRSLSTFDTTKSSFLNYMDKFWENIYTSTAYMEHFVDNIASRSTAEFEFAGSIFNSNVSIAGKCGVINAYYSAAGTFYKRTIQQLRKKSAFISVGVIQNTATTSMYNYFGIGAVPTAYNVVSTHSIYFKLTGSPLTLTSNVTTTTTTPTTTTLLSGAAIEDTWVQLSIQIDKSGNKATFYVHNYSGTLLASTTMDVSGVLDTAVSNAYWYFGSSAAVTTNSFYIDYIYAKEVM